VAKLWLGMERERWDGSVSWEGGEMRKEDEGGVVWGAKETKTRLEGARERSRCCGSGGVVGE
jgi:hypothetical protein